MNNLSRSLSTIYHVTIPQIEPFFHRISSLIQTICSGVLRCSRIFGYVHRKELNITAYLDFTVVVNFQTRQQTSSRLYPAITSVVYFHKNVYTTGD